MSKITNDDWHRMLYSCTHMATVSVKELNSNNNTQWVSYVESPCCGASRPVHSTGMLSYLSKLMPFINVSNTCSSSSGGGGGMYGGGNGFLSPLLAVATINHDSTQATVKCWNDSTPVTLLGTKSLTTWLNYFFYTDCSYLSCTSDKSRTLQTHCTNPRWPCM